MTRRLNSYLDCYRCVHDPVLPTILACCSSQTRLRRVSAALKLTILPKATRTLALTPHAEHLRQ